MSPARWQQVKEVFAAVQECEDAPDNLLHQLTGDDASLLREVERLLVHQTNVGDDFLEHPRFDAPPAMFNGPVFEEGQNISNRWQIRRLLGSGGMGEVYEAFDSELQESVALKTIRNVWTDDRGAFDRFRREIRIARKIGHPNICKVYDLFTHSGDGRESIPFVTMEMLEGQTLAERLRQGPLEPAQTLSYALQMADGLAAAHDKGIVHSDFKSANVMLVVQPDGKERLVITDFGLARNFTPGAEAAPDEPAGTPGYMAPEQWTGMGVTFATDIYSFGVVLYEMLTGAQPFGSTLSSSLLRRQQTGSSPTPLALRQDLDPKWEHIIGRCLDPEPARRFQDIYAVLEAFGPRVKPRSRWSAIIPAAAVIAIAPAALWLARLPQVPHFSESVLIMPFVAADQSAEAQYVSAGLTDELIGALARVPEIRVIARETAVNYGPTARLSDVAAKLRVDRVVRGRMSAEGDELYVTAEVIEPKSNRVLWSQRFHAPRRDGFALHEQVRAALVSSLQPASPETKRMAPHVPDSRAFRLYLEGQYYAQNAQRDDSMAIKASEAFQRAAEADPQYSDALVGIADASGALSGVLGIPLKELHDRQRDAAARALKLDPSSPAALAAQSSVYQHLDHNWNLAEQYLQRALKLQPGNARLHHLYAGLLSDMDRPDESMREFRQALDLDPDSLGIIVARDICLVRARRYAEAKQQIIDTLAREPRAFRLYSYLGAIYAKEGDKQHAVASYRQAVDRSKHDPLALLHQAYGLASLGMAAQARSIVQEVEKRPGNYFYIACVHGKLHEYDQAFGWLDRAVAEQDADLTLLKVHPYCDDLRTDPRFAKYLKLMNFD
jgi:TolB-like protein/Flp pilus assembly protein TadD/tRNA A-37 threonylcarbamoyl transferase component Bud32